MCLRSNDFFITRYQTKTSNAFSIKISYFSLTLLKYNDNFVVFLSCLSICKFLIFGAQLTFTFWRHVLLESVKIPVQLFCCCARLTTATTAAAPCFNRNRWTTIEIFSYIKSLSILICLICLSFRVTCDLLCNHHYGCHTNYSFQIYLIDRAGSECNASDLNESHLFFAGFYVKNVIIN